MNCLGFSINYCPPSSGSPVIPSNYLYNTSNIDDTTFGKIPIYSGSNLGETLVSSKIEQTVNGITITNDLNVNNITTADITDLNGTLNNITELLYNLTNIQTKV